MMEFTPQNYWERRLTRNFDLSGVGYQGLGSPFNNWMYKLRRHVFLKEIKKFIKDPLNARVLDIGCGTGFLIELWKFFGVKNLEGVDITETSIKNLRKIYPQYHFYQADISSPDIFRIIEKKFDIITASDVLFHIVDDNKYSLAIRNISKLLKNSGVFIFSENFLHKVRIKEIHQVSRTYNEILTILNNCNLELMEKRPLFFFMNSPINSNSQFFKLFWKALSKIVGKIKLLGYIFGPLLFVADYCLTGIFKEGPSTEIAICYHRDDHCLN